MPPRASLLHAPAPAPEPHHRHHHTSTYLRPIGGSAAAASFLVVLALLFRKLTRKRTAPTSSPSSSPQRFSYSSLKRATASFSPTRRLGQGGFGSVYSGTLPETQEPIAVKVMDSVGSLQGEREFNNELFFASKLRSPYVVSVIGFSTDRKRRRMLLVYELMTNGNLQDALLHKKCAELMEWKRRFNVAVDVAKGIEYLHGLDPPVIHGDVKPSNVLLDSEFRAKIADFGLARLKEESDHCEITVMESDVEKGNGNKEECGSVVEETESVVTTTTVFEDANGGGDDRSPESFARVMTSPETVDAVATSPEVASSVPEGNWDKGSLDCNGGGNRNNGKGVKSVSVKDWWWKQDNGGDETKKDYVMEWIGTEIKKERPSSRWIGASSSGENANKVEKKKNRRRLDWWISMDDEMTRKNLKKDKRRPMREWWKEDYRDEIARKKKKKKKKQQKGFYSDDNCGEDWWSRDEETYLERKKKSRNRSRGSRGSVDWWLDGLSGDLWRGRRNSYDSMSGEIPKSGGISSTPSMRGTVCYIAPEYGGGGDLSEKCDVYSFGVLLLVLIAGRRPLQVTGSPLSEFQRANLISWARYLARKNKLLDLVDKSIVSFDREQALLCITVALHCLQKSPVRRPSMKEVVAMLTGQLDPPHLPFEFFPSPPSRYSYKSQKKLR